MHSKISNNSIQMCELGAPPEPIYSPLRSLETIPIHRVEDWANLGQINFTHLIQSRDQSSQQKTVQRKEVLKPLKKHLYLPNVTRYLPRRSGLSPLLTKPHPWNLHQVEKLQSAHLPNRLQYQIWRPIIARCKSFKADEWVEDSQLILTVHCSQRKALNLVSLLSTEDKT